MSESYQFFYIQNSAYLLHIEYFKCIFLLKINKKHLELLHPRFVTDVDVTI